MVFLQNQSELGTLVRQWFPIDTRCEGNVRMRLLLKQYVKLQTDNYSDPPPGLFEIKLTPHSSRSCFPAAAALAFRFSFEVNIHEKNSWVRDTPELKASRVRAAPRDRKPKEVTTMVFGDVEAVDKGSSVRGYGAVGSHSRNC